MFKFTELEQIHLEITNNCQASCPMCSRNIHGGIENPLIKVNNWSLLDYKKIISTEVINQVRMIYFCGNYGDPLLNNDLLEMIEYTVSVKETIQIRVHTNGSLRSVDWWKKLASVMPKNHKVIFAIDGLEDTHSIYRIGTNYNKIIENAKAFISNGGKADWAFIRFNHNEYQVTTAKEIAKNLGFESFVMKDSLRFNISNKFPVYDKNKNIVNYLKPSSYSELKFIDKKLIENYKSILEKTEIDCVALKAKEIYIDSQYNLFPCCWLGLIPYQAQEDIELMHIRQDILDQYKSLVESLGGIDKLSTLENTVKSIIDSEPYQTVWTEYWNTNKLITCGKSCGKLPNVFSTPKNQFTQSEILSER